MLIMICLCESAIVYDILCCPLYWVRIGVYIDVV